MNRVIYFHFVHPPGIHSLQEKERRMEAEAELIKLRSSVYLDGGWVAAWSEMSYHSDYMVEKNK